MLLFIECLIACVIFTLIVLPAQYKNPIKYIMSYPPEVRKRVASLPQYQDSIKSEEKEHIVKKIIAALLGGAIFAVVAYFSGATNFWSAFFHVFILFNVLNVFDMLILDIGVFCRSKKLRIPGTEDMDKEYKDYLFHVKGAVRGLFIGTVVSLLAAGLVQLVSVAQT